MCLSCFRIFRSFNFLLCSNLTLFLGKNIVLFRGLEPGVGHKVEVHNYLRTIIM